MENTVLSSVDGKNLMAQVDENTWTITGTGKKPSLEMSLEMKYTLDTDRARYPKGTPFSDMPQKTTHVKAVYSDWGSLFTMAEVSTKNILGKYMRNGDYTGEGLSKNNPVTINLPFPRKEKVKERETPEQAVSRASDDEKRRILAKLLVELEGPNTEEEDKFIEDIEKDGLVENK